ncbi:MAG: hypothetical protein ABI589_02620 [Burkholderiales bacterium]
MAAINISHSKNSMARRGIARSLACWATLLLSLLVLAAGATAAAAATGDEVVVIVNKYNPNVVDQAFVLNVYSGAIQGWPDGSPVFPLDQMENSDTRNAFAQTVLGKRPATISAIWAQHIFTGKGLPPKTVKADAEMKRIVSTNRNAIGYILRSELDESVRALPR